MKTDNRCERTNQDLGKYSDEFMVFARGKYHKGRNGQDRPTRNNHETTIKQSQTNPQQNIQGCSFTKKTNTVPFHDQKADWIDQDRNIVWDEVIRQTKPTGKDGTGNQRGKDEENNN